MAQWADYLISGIWKAEQNGSKYVSYVMLHKDSETTFGKGVKTSKDDVILLIKNGSKIKTMTWNYEKAIWKLGALVNIELTGGVSYLRTAKDASISDNLDNLIPMSGF